MILKHGHKILWHASYWKVLSMSYDLDSGFYDIWSINNGMNDIMAVSGTKLEKSVNCYHVSWDICSWNPNTISWRVQNEEELGASIPQPWLSSDWHPELTYQSCDWPILKVGPPVVLSQLMPCEAEDNCPYRALSKFCDYNKWLLLF